jgi:hypothetical protein
LFDLNWSTPSFFHHPSISYPLNLARHSWTSCPHLTWWELSTSTFPIRLLLFSSVDL